MDDILCAVGFVAAFVAIACGFIGLILTVGWLTDGWPCTRAAKAYDMETVWTLQECYIKTPDGTMTLKTFEEKLRAK